VADAVNRNSFLVTSLKTTQARISSGWMPTSAATHIALERPRRFRLRVETLLTGALVDAGSNDELFWFWSKDDPAQQIYFCRHDQFHRSPARQLLPVEPEWLIEAFGLAQFSPREQHRGPFAVGRGRLRIESLRETPAGPVTKVTVVDDKYAHVLEQHLYDERGTPLASALTSQHQQDPLSGAWLPKQVELVFPNQQGNLRISVDRWEVNTLGPHDIVLWEMPRESGLPVVDLCAGQ
jgi:hypothetical protein